jgi:Fe-S-cluster containining protein
MRSMSFYRSGLRFECARCSRCCRHDPGFVFLSNQDLERILEGLSIDREAFIERYCVWVPTEGGSNLSLAERPDYDCIFWREGGCRIYDFRPVQCRSFPFWPSHLSSQADWKNLRGQCTGIDKGSLHTAEEIDRWVRFRGEEPLILRKSMQEVDI